LARNQEYRENRGDPRGTRQKDHGNPLPDWFNGPDARTILNATRLHWGIENGMHCCLDVAFREDASAVHLRRAAANLGLVRMLALNLFRLDTGSTLSLPRKRKQAPWKPDYLLDLPGMQSMTEF
jgi:hypothetical protein